MYTEKLMTLSSKNNEVQVVMPVGWDRNHSSKQKAIKSALESSGYLASFPDYDPEQPLFVLSEFLQKLSSSAFVIADLTGERPSVYFELGLAQALGKNVLIIAESGTPVHQHAAVNNVIEYRGLEDLELKLKAVLGDLG